MRDYIISSVQETNLTNKNGVYQDSLIAYDRDASGRIWAILGHTNLGGISVWSGESLCRLQKKYPAEFLFSLGEAGAAFNASTYPDGPLSRGRSGHAGCGSIRIQTASIALFIMRRAGELAHHPILPLDLLRVNRISGTLG